MRVDGAKLRQARERRLITQPELSDLSGVMVATISRIENGLQQPRIPTVRKLTKALGVEADELIDWQGEAQETGKAAA
ncbi:MAG: helix-turn-helix domain-containing protein [Chloroflexota bacterium]|nr:helix-turn-helix domain-containing protein [Chloroflexota bacterium]MDP9469565.1 helix-turn-helix domain-containing protein [Chloroflexota bacterium]